MIPEAASTSADSTVQFCIQLSISSPRSSLVLKAGGRSTLGYLAVGTVGADLGRFMHFRPQPERTPGKTVTVIAHNRCNYGHSPCRYGCFYAWCVVEAGRREPLRVTDLGSPPPRTSCTSLVRSSSAAPGCILASERAFPAGVCFTQPPRCDAPTEQRTVGKFRRPSGAGCAPPPRGRRLASRRGCGRREEGTKLWLRHPGLQRDGSRCGGWHRSADGRG